MPAFTKCDDSKQKAVFAVISRFKARAANEMRKRIDAEGAVIQERGANAESPDKHLHSRCSKLRSIRLEAEA